MMDKSCSTLLLARICLICSWKRRCQQVMMAPDLCKRKEDAIEHADRSDSPSSRDAD